MLLNIRVLAHGLGLVSVDTRFDSMLEMLISDRNLWIESDYCINTAAFYIANGVMNSVSDLLILALPIPVIWGLSLARRQKIHLCMMFGVGGVSCVISIMRLKSIIIFLHHGNSDTTYDIVDINIWS